MPGTKFKPIMFVPDDDTRTKVEKLAEKEHRKLGPMALEIVRRFFAGKSVKDAS